MNPDEMSTLVRAERLALIDTLGGLDDDLWRTSSLCNGWRILDVAAHLAWAPVMGVREGMAALLRYGPSTNAVIARTAVAWSDRGRDAILEQLRDNAATGARPIGMPPVAALADAVVHGFDVRRPLALEHPVPVEVMAPLADFVLRTPWPLNLTVGGSARRRVAGVRLAASDSDWTHGSGPDVVGSTEALLLLLFGRHPRPEELAGPGAEVLVTRR